MIFVQRLRMPVRSFTINIFAMIKSLKAVGAESAVVRSYNALAVNVDVLDCDYYRFQELDLGAVNAYETEYMNQYDWADFLYNGY